MPTLITVPVARPAEAETEEMEDEDDASETVLYDQSVTLLDGSIIALDSSSSPQESGANNGTTIAQTSAAQTQHEEQLVDESATILYESFLDEGSKAVKGDTQDKDALEDAATQTIPQQPTQKNPRTPLKSVMGPNEALYRSKYEPFVKKTLQRFEDRNPGKLVDYRSLSREQQAVEQQRVMSLLSRLGIGKGAAQSQKDIVMQQQERRLEDRQRLLDDTMSPLMSPSCHAPPRLDEEEQGSSTSPFNVPERDSPIMNQSCSLLTSPVEITRAAKESSSIYDSPRQSQSTSQAHKRLATSSAKRGADSSRFRYNEDAGPSLPRDDFDDEEEDDFNDHLASRMERLSISPAAAPSIHSPQEDFFPASQSPISPKLTYASSPDSAIEGEGMRKAVRASDDTIDTWSTHKISERRQRRDKPTNVGIKDGATFHLEKLNVKRSELTRLKNGIGGTRRRLIDFPDPFVRYSSKEKKVLNGVFQSLLRSEEDSMIQTFVETTSANVLYSMTQEMVTDLCLKLLLEDETKRDSRSRRRSPPAHLQGQTMVVGRSKDDLTEWERALREQTGCSVFNHAATPLSERVRLTTAEKSTKFDVVLTTFDALKASDAAIPINDNDHASFVPAKQDNGWLVSRGGSSQAENQPQKCKKLSVLHKVNFRRVVFLDILGRKSFLAKYGTARANAATALRANSRIVFFCKTEADGDSPIRTLTKSDKRAKEALMSILHLSPLRDDDSSSNSSDDSSDDEDDEKNPIDPLATCSLDIKNLF